MSDVGDKDLQLIYKESKGFRGVLVRAYEFGVLGQEERWKIFSLLFVGFEMLTVYVKTSSIILELFLMHLTKNWKSLKSFFLVD